MVLHDPVFSILQLAGLIEDVFGNGDLADIVEQSSGDDNIDVDVSGVINQGLTLDQATDIVQDKLVDVCWGAMTSSDMLGEIETAASRLLRTL